MTTIEERLDQDFERIDERLGKLETDATSNTVVQRQLAENIENLSKKVTEGFARMETRLGGVESAVRANGEAIAQLATEIRNGRS